MQLDGGPWLGGRAAPAAARRLHARLPRLRPRHRDGADATDSDVQHDAFFKPRPKRGATRPTRDRGEARGRDVSRRRDRGRVFGDQTVLMGSLCLFGFAGNTLSMVCLRRDKSRSATPRHTARRRVTLHHAVSRHVKPRHAASRRVTPCHAVSRHVKPRHAASRRVTPCHAVSRSATPLLLISLEISDTLFLSAVFVVRVISSFQVAHHHPLSVLSFTLFFSETPVIQV